MSQQNTSGGTITAGGSGGTAGTAAATGGTEKEGGGKKEDKLPKFEPWTKRIPAFNMPIDTPLQVR